MIVRDFLSWIEYYTQKEQTTMMIIRTTGPDSATDSAVVNSVYSKYYFNLQQESPELFKSVLYNEFTFVEFTSEEEAYQFGLENFPVNKDLTDPDYFIQFFIFSNGNLAYANDELNSLSYKVATLKPE